MTTDIRNALASCVDKPPEDLVALYSSPLPASALLRINLLSLPDAIAYTRAIHANTLLGERMGLFALDDANDSNPFCYVTCGPAKGCILRLHHDGDVAVEYSSLSAFLEAVEVAIRERLSIDHLPGKDLRPKIDQDVLCDHISRLVGEDSDEAECELTIQAALLDTARLDAVRSLSVHPSFFVREATARLIAARPNAQLIGVAKSLANDLHSQVAEVGKKALTAVNRSASSY